MTLFRARVTISPGTSSNSPSCFIVCSSTLRGDKPQTFLVVGALSGKALRRYLLLPRCAKQSTCDSPTKDTLCL
jgi:hypothetical protein